VAFEGLAAAVRTYSGDVAVAGLASGEGVELVGMTSSRRRAKTSCVMMLAIACFASSTAAGLGHALFAAVADRDGVADCSMRTRWNEWRT